MSEAACQYSHHLHASLKNCNIFSRHPITVRASLNAFYRLYSWCKNSSIYHGHPTFIPLSWSSFICMSHYIFQKTYNTMTIRHAVPYYIRKNSHIRVPLPNRFPPSHISALAVQLNTYCRVHATNSPKLILVLSSHFQVSIVLYDFFWGVLNKHLLNLGQIK